MKIALVCPYAWDAAGGVQVHVADLAGQLRSRGHEVRVVAPREDAAAGRVVRVPYRGTVAPIAPSPLAVRRLRRGFAVWRPDLVHVHEPFTPSTSMWAALASPAPVVATVHAHLDRSRLYERAAPLLAPVARRLAATVAVSEAAARFVRAAMPAIDPVVIPNGVDVDAFASASPEPAPDGRRVAWVHRLDPQKGFRIALEAFGALLVDVPDARLVVAGDGPGRSLVATLELAIRERVTPLGAVTHARVPGVLAGSAVAIAPATGQESFGITLVEAMAAGVPVVASDIDGYREVVHDGVDGLLVPPGDAAALAAAMRAILTDGDLAARLSAAGRERAAAFDWPVVVDRLEDVYRRALAAGPRLR